MITLLTALLFAVQSPPSGAQLERIGPHVPACIQGKALPNELIETCAERLAVIAEAAAVRRAAETAEALRLWGEPCNAFAELAGDCPAEQLMASHARRCIDARPVDETLQACVARLEDRRQRWAAMQAEAEEAQRRNPAPPPTPEPEPTPEPPSNLNGCRRERVVSPDGQSVSYSVRCNRTWTN
jgi:hypothetical protein